MKSSKIEKLPDFEKGEMVEYENDDCNYIVLVTGKGEYETQFTGVIIFDFESGYGIGYLTDSFNKAEFKKFNGVIELQN
jgi:hypothetical protein